MNVDARLVAVRVPDRPTGAVIVLHGGGARHGQARVSPAQLSVLRMIPLARRIASTDRKLAVFRLLNSYRGWDISRSPVDDTLAALDRIRERFHAPLPTTLVGHSLGGRAALRAGVHPDVASVVALNAYLHRDDLAIDLAERRVLFVHGDNDRVAERSFALAVASRVAVTTSVEFVHVRGGNHSMLRRTHAFEQSAARFVVDSQRARRAGADLQPGLFERDE